MNAKHPLTSGAWSKDQLRLLEALRSQLRQEAK